MSTLYHFHVYKSQKLFSTHKPCFESQKTACANNCRQRMEYYSQHICISKAQIDPDS